MRAPSSIPAAAILLLSACASDQVGPAPSGIPATTSVSGIAIVSGNNQQGKAGEPLAQWLVVRAADGRGNGVSGARVTFSVTEGGGTLASNDDFLPGLSLATGADGLARVIFRPTVLGRSAVTARIDGIESVTFVANATVLVIERWGPLYDIGFIGPTCFCSDVTVPIGTPIEWKNHERSSSPDMTYTVTSTAVPPGGSTFDSGVMHASDRFRFVPAVAGTWSYRDTLTDRVGTVTAR